MTTVFFVRHAEPNYDNHNDMIRELSSKGLQGGCRTENELLIFWQKRRLM